ncbi:deoxynucleotide monophosphate kinase [Labrys portucalensis]|uniref:Deoxynucleotide monophosphate kinase n=1 Tax=Labrys neptuniae TaxID=376174 RepID=A0ABV6ZK19_9HYPH
MSDATKIKVVGFGGVAGSGKSTAAKGLEAYGFRRAKFAGALKEMLRALLRYRGASPRTIERMLEGDLKETPSRFLNGATPRRAMQTLGTEWGRDLIDPNLWVDTESDHWQKIAMREGSLEIAYDDVRLPNEAASIHARGGIVIGIEREGAGSATGASHSSEARNFEPDVVIRNVGSEADFTEAVADAVAYYAWT